MKLFFTVIYFLVSVSVFGQTITDASLPKVNTQNSYYTSLNTDPNEILKTGSGQTWDISGVSGGIITTTKYEDPTLGQFSNLYPQATYFTNEGGQSETYYLSNAAGLKVLGSPTPSFINPGVIEKGEIHPPVFEIKTPMALGAQLNQSAYIVINIPISIIPDSILNTLPIKPDSLRLKISTTYNYECTGSGVLKCPGKNFNVLQQTANVTTINNAEAKLPFLGWIDISNLVDFGLGQEEVSTLITFWSVDHVGFVAQFQVRPNLQDIVTAKYTTEGTVLKSKGELIEDKSVEIYPNPFRDELNIRKNGEVPTIDHVQIVSLNGSIILDRAIRNVEIINVQELLPGAYIVNLFSSGNVVASKKIFKLK